MAAALVTVSPAAADCGMQEPPNRLDAYRGVAFIGHVTANEPTRLRYLPGGSSSDEIRLTFAVERPIAGVTGDEAVVIGGERGNCSNFWASVLAVGDRVLISFRPPRDEDEFELDDGAHIAWYALVWRPTDDGGWRFARGAVQFAESHPASAKAADSLSEILALVGPELPPTDTAPVASGRGVAEGVLVLAGIAGAVLTVRRFRRRVAP